MQLPITGVLPNLLWLLSWSRWEPESCQPSPAKSRPCLALTPCLAQSTCFPPEFEVPTRKKAGVPRRGRSSQGVHTHALLLLINPYISAKKVGVISGGLTPKPCNIQRIFPLLVKSPCLAMTVWLHLFLHQQNQPDLWAAGTSSQKNWITRACKKRSCFGQKGLHAACNG